MRTKYYFSIIFITTLYLICQSCKSKQTDYIYSDYYYPKKEQVLVYQIDSFASMEYWAVSFNNNQYETQIFNQNYALEQKVLEKRLSSGVRVGELELSDQVDGAMHTISAKINHGDVFSFKPLDVDDVLVYSASWDQPSDDTHYDLYRNRRFVKDTTVSFKNNEYPAIIYAMKEQIVSRKDGDIKLNIDAKEVYAKGIGLLYRAKRLENGLERHIYLHNQMTFEAFERQKNEESN